MPTLEATRIVRYAGKDQQIGDRFEAPEKDAKILVAIQKAKYSDGPVKTPSDLPADVMSRAWRAPEVEEVKKKKEEVEDEAPKQTYQHRAMVAEAPKAKPVEPMRYPSTPSRFTGKPTGSGPGLGGKGKK